MPPVPLEPVPPRFLGRAAPLYGLVAGTLAYVLAYGGAVVGGFDEQGYWALSWLGAGALVSVPVFLVGLTLTIIAHTRAFGAGVLISIGFGLIVGSGVCIAVLSSQ